MFGKKKDNKIRVRCRECGKKLKLPADEPGRVFRCPICASTVIAPLEIDPNAEVQESASSSSGSLARERMSFDAADSVFDRPAKAKGPSRAKDWRPQIKAEPENKSINDLVAFLNRENERVRDIAVASLQDPNKTPEQRERRLASLRKEKSQKLRAEIDKIVGRLDDEIHAVSRGADTRNAEVRRRLEEKTSQKRELLTYVRAFFGLKLPDTQRTQPPLD